MQINLIAIGTRMPNWVTQGYQHYAQRLTQDNCRLNLIEVPSKKRLKSTNLTQLLVQEGQQLLAAAPKQTQLIALERVGRSIDSHNLAQQLKTWQLQGQSVSFLIGGPEGLSPECCQQAHSLWSLSALTLPHPLVRIVLAEQLYRAYCILQNHPYHR